MKGGNAQTEIVKSFKNKPNNKKRKKKKRAKGLHQKVRTITPIISASGRIHKETQLKEDRQDLFVGAIRGRLSAEEPLPDSIPLFEHQKRQFLR